MRILLVLLLFLISTFLLKAEQTIVSGKVSGGDGQVIRLMVHDDFISKKNVTLDSYKIASDGSFKLTIEIGETIMAYLDINYQQAEIFLEPGKTYRLDVNYDRDNHLASYFDRQGLVFDFVKPEADNLNLLIWQFNKMYNAFIMTDFEQVSRFRDKGRINEFRQEADSAFKGIGNKYLSDYITYKIAGMEQFARIKGKAQLVNEYLANRPALYQNVEYTFFFQEVFQKFLITSPDMITVSDLIIAVNDHADIKPILDAMAAEPWLNDPGLRELALLHALKELYHHGTYKQPQVLSMIRQIEETTRDPMHARIAVNLISALTFLRTGTPAPDLQLTGIAGQKFRLRNIKGKPILLTFFRSAQEGTDNAFTRLSELYNLYKAGLEIISVSMDNDPKAYIPLANSGNYRWTFAHYGNDPQVYDLYNIKDLPMYILIDVEGNIFLCPAPPPGEELEKQVVKVVH